MDVGNLQSQLTPIGEYAKMLPQRQSAEAVVADQKKKQAANLLQQLYTSPEFQQLPDQQKMQKAMPLLAMINPESALQLTQASAMKEQEMGRVLATKQAETEKAQTQQLNSLLIEAAKTNPEIISNIAPLLNKPGVTSEELTTALQGYSGKKGSFDSSEWREKIDPATGKKTYVSLKTGEEKGGFGGTFYKPTKDTNTDRPTITQLTQIRKEFGEQITDFSEIRSKFLGLDKVFTDYEKNKKDIKQKGSLDQSLIVLFNKMLDPGSVVREGEYARTEEGVSLLSKASTVLAKAEAGGVGLTDSDRYFLVRTAALLAKSGEEYATSQKDYYDSLAQSYNADPLAITGGFKKIDNLDKYLNETNYKKTSPTTAVDYGAKYNF